MDEEWRSVVGWPDYIVSNLGRVYNTRRQRMLKTSPDSKGYPTANLDDGVRRCRKAVHILVASAFVAGYFEGAEVNHKDGVKTNPTPENLEWVTHGDNMRHAVATGLSQGRRSVKRPRIVIPPNHPTRRRTQ